MKHREQTAVLLMSAIILVANDARALCPTDPATCDVNAKTYLLRTNCGTLPNCFNSMAALTGSWPDITVAPVDPAPASCSNPAVSGACTVGWLWATRQPDEDDRVVIDVGPGTFGPFICPGKTGTPHGHVIVRGSGRDQTFIKASPTNPRERVGIHVNGCEELVFSNLHAEGPTYGVHWLNGGEATWTSVDMASTQSVLGTGLPENQHSAGWNDESTVFPAVKSTHFLYDCRSSASTIQTATQKLFGYRSLAAETYFFGGSIVTGPSMQTGIAKPSWVYGVYGESIGDFNAFDTQIIVKDENGAANTFGVAATITNHILLQGVSLFVRGGPYTEAFNSFADRILVVDTAVDASSY